MNNVRNIECIVTSTEHEALLLENSLIKEHQPRYNINLKDSKSYPVIRITKEEFPKIFRTRRIIQDGSEYFGPFPNVQAIDIYLDLIEKLFPLRKCRGKVKPRKQPCLYYHIGRCAAVCAGKTSKEDYLDRVDQARRLLNGEAEEVSSRLERRMTQSSAELKFEDAAWCRDALRALEDLNSRQSVVDFDPETRDYIAMYRQKELCVFTVFQMRGGKLLGTESFRSRSVEDDREAIAEFIDRYYSSLKQPPRRIFTQIDFTTPDGRIPDLMSSGPPPEWRGTDLDIGTTEAASVPEAAETEPAYESGHSACVLPDISSPENHRDSAVLNMAVENARQELSAWLRDEGDTDALEELAEIIGLSGAPLRIEGFDIAQLHGKHTVAAMVHFFRGAPDKSEYRRYHIRSLKGKIDDFAAMREAVARRYTRLQNEEKKMPDLILIDGGKGQVSAAKQVLRALDLDHIPLLGLAKQFEEIILPGHSESLRLPEGSPALRILQHVRDEAHRFSTGFNQLLRAKDINAGVIEQVEGIGPGKSKRLLQTFGSLEGIATADTEDIMSCAGISETASLQLKLLAKEAAEQASFGEDTETQSETTS
ncbi:excinuclease ABC subunit UvrC [Spirochaeta dissipatitropha]